MRHPGNRRADDFHPAIRRFADDEIQRAERGVLVGIVLAKVASAAFATLDRRPGDGFRDRQQAVQIQSGVPAGVVLPMPADADAALARTQRIQAVERPLHLRLCSHDPDQIMHHVLQGVLHLIRILAARAAIEGLDRPPGGLLQLLRVDRTALPALCELRRELAGMLSEDEDVRERVTAEAIRPVDAGRALARGKQAGHRRHLRVAVDPHPAHDVVGCRTDLHGLLGDVEVGKLLELVVHAGQLFLDVLGPVRDPRLDPGDVEEHAAVRTAPAGFDLPHDAAAHVVACQQLRRPPGGLVALGVAPALFLVVRGLRSIILGDLLEHEPAALAVPEDAALAAHRFGDENASDARRPDHAGWMELDELHVHQLRARVIGERVAVARVFPAVARDLVGAAHAAGRENHRFGLEQLEPSALALVAERADHAAVVLEQRDDRALHVHVDPLVDAVILQRADHLESGAVADVGQPRIPVAAEIPLKDPAVAGPIEHRAPRFELADTVGCFLRVQLRHAPVVHILAAAHRVGEMDLPVVPVVDVRQRGRNASLGHHRVGFSEQRLADEADGDAGSRRLDGRPQPRAACADDEHVVFVGLVVGHQKILRSDHTPIEQSRTYRSLKPTVNRLVQAHTMWRRLRHVTQEYARRPSGARES